MPNVFTLHIDGLEPFIRDVETAKSQVTNVLQKAMVNSVNTIKNDAQLKAPYKTGTLRRSIFMNVLDSGLTGIVAQDSDMASYGQDVEFGTKPHEILPVNKKALFWKGALNPYKRVMHPGSAPHPYMIPAFEQNIEKVQQFFSDALLKLLQIAGGKG